MYYLFSVWGSCWKGDRNSALEEFDTLEEAKKGIDELKTDHPDCTYKLVEGEELQRG
jgi:hypothetical protein